MAEQVDFSVHWTTVGKTSEQHWCEYRKGQKQNKKQTCTKNFGSSDQRASKKKRIETFSPAPALAGIPESTKHDEITKIEEGKIRDDDKDEGSWNKCR